MLNLRSKLLKVILFAFSLMFFGINSTFGMDSAPPIQNDQRYAKVVFLGYFGSGKTVLYNLLTNKQVGLDDTDHTLQIDTSVLGMNIKGTKVDVYFNDSSAEPRHKDVMYEFCKNAHIVFLVIDALKLSNRKGWAPASQRHFEELVCKLSTLAPKCRIVIIKSKAGLINKKQSSRGTFAKDEVDRYVELIEENLAEEGEEVRPADEKYDLTLTDLTGEEAKEHRENLYRIIAESLTRYGLKNLPKEPKGFLGKIFEDKVYIQKKFLFWEYGEQKEDESKLQVSLIQPGKNVDEKKPYNPETTKKTVEYKQCVIF